MAKQKQIKITFKGEDGETQEGWVTEEALPGWEANGWTVVEDGSSESAPVVTQAPAPTEQQKAEVKSQPRPTENK